MIAARLREGEPERGAQIGRSARGGENGCENALEEGAGVSFARAPADQSSGGRGWKGDLENAEEIECKNEHDRTHRDDEIGVGKLEGPGDFAARGFEGDHEGREPDKPCEDADRESEAIAENTRPTVAGVLDETENLERNHRQDARHEIEDETSNEAEEEELQQASWRLSRRGDFPRTGSGRGNVAA